MGGYSTTGFMIDHGTTTWSEWAILQNRFGLSGKFSVS